MKITALCLLTVTFMQLLRQNSPAFALLLLSALGVAVLAYLLKLLDPLLSFLQQLMQTAQLSDELFMPLIKTLGIALVVKLGSGLCRDSGSAAAASLIEIAGGFCALLVSVPLLRAVLQLLSKWL